MRPEALRIWRKAAMSAALALSAGILPGTLRAQEEHAGKDLRTVLFGSLDAGRSAFVTSGMKRTLAGPLDESGPVVMASMGIGEPPDRAQAGAGKPSTSQPAAQANALLGHQWALGKTFLSLFAGPEFDQDLFPSPAGLGPQRTTRVGVRVQGELWMHPSETTLVTATVLAGTARGHAWGRLSAGYKVWRDVFVGPEATLYRTEGYHEWRLGMHATGLQIGRFQLRLSGGWRYEEETRRPSPYGSLSAYIRM